MFAILFHGEGLLEFFVFVLLLYLAASTAAAHFIVKHFRSRFGRRVYLFAALVFLMIGALAYGGLYLMFR